MTEVELKSYDKIIVMFSGGKDSTATVLNLLEMGIAPDQIELWHHDIDGRGDQFMDWPCTPIYCERFAEEFDIKIYFSWRQGGFLREMLRNDEPTAPVTFQEPYDLPSSSVYHRTVGGKGPKGTRGKFPQVTANLKQRWCSAALKIDVADIALKNQERFRGMKTLVITGERAEESPGRAKYSSFEPHRSDLRDGVRFQRYIDHWRPVHQWPEEKVWDIIERWNVQVHPAYYLSWGRLSCMTCIFGSANQWASANYVAPQSVQEIIRREKESGMTIHRTKSVEQLIAEGDVYSATRYKKLLRWSQQKDGVFPGQIRMPADVTWTLPAGAYGESAGPT